MKGLTASLADEIVFPFSNTCNIDEVTFLLTSDGVSTTEEFWVPWVVVVVGDSEVPLEGSGFCWALWVSLVGLIGESGKDVGIVPKSSTLDWRA